MPGLNSAQTASLVLSAERKSRRRVYRCCISDHAQIHRV